MTATERHAMTTGGIGGIIAAMTDATTGAKCVGMSVESRSWSDSATAPPTAGIGEPYGNWIAGLPGCGPNWRGIAATFAITTETMTAVGGKSTGSDLFSTDKAAAPANIRSSPGPFV